LELVRDGIPLNQSPDSIRETLTEAHLFHFVNRDPHISRDNPDTKKYTGVFKITFESGESVFVYPLEDDFKQIYQFRKDSQRCWEILSDDTPYWVDVYLHRVLNRMGKAKKLESAPRDI
jgi:hypothetical protein